MTQPPDYVGRPYQPVHSTLASSYQWQGMSQDQLEGLRKRLIESIIQIVVQAIKGFFIPAGPVGDAYDQLTNWFIDIVELWGNPIGLGTGSPILPSLPNIPFLAPLQTAIDYIWDAFDTGIPNSSSGNPLESVFDAVFGIFGTGSNAQAVNVIQDSRLDALVGGGSALSDAFDGAASSALNSTKWTQIYSGGGSGTCGLSGDGFCIWNTSGSSARGSENIYKLAATTTDTQSVSLSLGANISSTSGAPAEVHLIGRSNLAGTDYVVAGITESQAGIFYVVGGTVTQIGSVVSLSTSDTSGTWQLKLGTATDDREFVLLHNGSTVISRTDTSDTSLKDATHRYTGFEIIAGWTFSIFFGFPVQVAPPPVGAWAASDRDPAS
jgi:hypothetical protein